MKLKKYKMLKKVFVNVKLYVARKWISNKRELFNGLMVDEWIK